MFEVIHHTETVKPEAWIVFVRKNGKLERAAHLGKRGGFKTKAEAETAAFNAERYGTQNV
jgi:hypothetical protein